MSTKNPRSIPGGWGKETPTAEGQDPLDTQSVPRSAAGIVGESGDILDQEGKVIGKITDLSNIGELAGNTVTETGDVIGSAGDVLGKAVLDDGEHSEYTTQSPELEKGNGEGWNVLGKAKSAYDTAQALHQPAVKGLGILRELKGRGDGGQQAGERSERWVKGEQGWTKSKEQSQGGEEAEQSGGAKLGQDDESQTVQETEKAKEETLGDVEGKAPEAEQQLDVQQQELQPDVEMKDVEEATEKGVEPDVSDEPKLHEKIEHPQTSAEEETPQSEDVQPPGDTARALADVETGKLPEVQKPEVEKPEFEKPEVEKPEVEKPESKETTPKGPEIATTKAKEPEVEKLEAKGQELREPEMEEHEVPKPETGEVGVEPPETKVPEFEPPEVKQPEVEQTELKQPATKEPEVEAGLRESEAKQAEMEEPETIESTEEKKVKDSTTEKPEIESTIDTKPEVQEKLDDTQKPLQEVQPKDVEQAPTDDLKKAVETEEPIEQERQEEIKEVPKDLVEASIDEGKPVGQEELTEDKPRDDQGGDDDKSQGDKEKPFSDVAALQEEQPPKSAVSEESVKDIQSPKPIEEDTSVIVQTEEPTDKAVGGTQSLKPVEDDVATVAQTEAPVEKPEEGVEGIEGVEGGLTKEKEVEGVETVEREVGKETEPQAEEEQKEEEKKGKPLDYTILKGTKVNKAGNLVNKSGDVLGRLVEGDPKKLIGKRSDEEGQIWDDGGNIIGKAEPLPDSEREDLKDFAPFENFPDATVEADGRVMSGGRQVGSVIEGDPKRLKGSKVDEDGDILDRRGNVVGKAEAWDEPEPEPEQEVDRSILAGKRVNKVGNVVDSSGSIFGRVVEGNVIAMVGRMCDKKGNILSESGDIIGKAEVISEGEREGLKEGPFAELSGCTVTKEGKVITPSGDVVGRLIKGDPKVLFGRPVDDDGDILDRNGNVLGKAERWEEPEVEKKKSPLDGRKVNRDGNVLDEDGNIIAKLVAGDKLICSGKEVDEDGDVINSKGNTIGHVALLEDIPPEPEESAEDKAKREQAEKEKQEEENDRKLAEKIAGAIEQALDKVRPICKLITDKIDHAERTPKDELNEEQLVKEVKPLIEEGGKILTELNGSIRGLDPDGRIQRKAKHKSGTKDASPEEYHLADVLKELATTVTNTIDNAKRKIEGMPHAKKELNPLWGLLGEPLVQIIAAVGLLLTGVLNLVGRLLSGLGLGGLVDALLGGLGLKQILSGLGLGTAVEALTGKKKK